MEVMGRYRYLHGKNNFPILFSFFSLSYSSLSFSPPFISFFLFVFFFSSFQIFLLFFFFSSFFFLDIVTFLEKKKITFEDFA